MSDYAIEATELVRQFKNGPRAVDGIDLAVTPGEIYGFLGPNGAGKSTTVHMLTTLLPPTSGTARVAGFDVVHDGPQVRARIGAALQEAALDPLLTGREHVRLQASLQGLPRADRVRIIDHGHIVAEGTPAALKAEVGRPTIEAVPADLGQLDSAGEVLARFGELVPCSDGGVAVRLKGGESELADVVRALDAEGL